MFEFQKKKGFTLIELLVVIAIIALLLSILLPSLQKAKDQAKRVLCSARLRNFGVAELSYAANENRLFPRYVTLADSIRGADINYDMEVTTVLPFIITTAFYKHMKNQYGMEAKTWVCPSVENGNGTHYEFIDDNGDLTKRHENSGFWPSDSANIGFANLAGLVNLRDTDPKGCVEESAKSPNDRSDKILAADLILRWDTWLFAYSSIPHRGNEGFSSGSNRLYIDGSVRWYSASVLARDDKPISDDARGKYRHTYDTSSAFGDPYPRSYFW